MISSQNKNKAFTLAETLITLAVIGVVAALTIPTLQQKYTEHITVNKVKKFYSTLKNAYAMAVQENGTPDLWGSQDITTRTQEQALNAYNILIKPYFKIARDCGFSNEKKCTAEITYLLNGSSQNTNYSQNVSYPYYKFVLEDGISAWVRGGNEVYFDVFIDTNGTKGPNQWGKDIFDFYAKMDNSQFILIPGGTLTSSNPFDSNCNSKSTGWGCTAWVVYKGNMEYLRCDDLKWNGKQKCSK